MASVRIPLGRWQCMDSWWSVVNGHVTRSAHISPPNDSKIWTLEYLWSVCRIHVEGAMEALYHQTNRLVQGTQQCFEKLEKAGDINSDAIEREIQARIDSITRWVQCDVWWQAFDTTPTNSVSGFVSFSNCERLDILLYKEPLNRRTNGKLRIDQLKYDRVHLQAALDTFRNRKYQRLQEEREREALLNLQFQPNNCNETSILMDHSQKHHSSLQNANRGVDDILQSGAGILENLRDQRMTIKGAHRRLYDIANTLGLSNTTMRFIERRAYQDQFILFGGMVVTLIVIGLIVVYCT